MKDRKIYLRVGLAFLLLMTISFSYAYFSINVSGNDNDHDNFYYVSYYGILLNSDAYNLYDVSPAFRIG